MGKLLESLEKQSFRDFEIVVVDNNSTDATKKIAQKYTKKVFNKGPERSVQRNYGAKKASGKYVLILDADMVLTKGVLQGCVKEVKKSEKTGGLIIPEKSFGMGYWAKVKAFEREFYVGDETIEAPRFFKKDLFLKFGGYDTEITGPEDYDLPLRMRKSGERIGRIGEYILHNEKKFSVFGSAKKKFYYASNARKYMKKHPEKIIVQGNFILRPVYFKKWRKLVGHPVLAVSMFFMRAVEMAGALLGVASSILRGVFT